MSERMQVVVAVFEHRFGTDVRVFKKIEGADEWRNQIGDEWWDREFPGDERPDPDEIGKVYFDAMSESGDEYFSVHTATVES